MKDVQAYMEFILECIAAIDSYLDDADLEDPKTNDAVLRRLQILAEATLKLPEDLTAPYTDVGWSSIRNFRNRLVHEYFNIDPEVVDRVIKVNLPKLKIAVETMLAPFTESDL